MIMDQVFLIIPILAPNGAGPMLGDVYADKRTPQGGKARKLQAPARLPGPSWTG